MKNKYIALLLAVVFVTVALVTVLPVGAESFDYDLMKNFTSHQLNGKWEIGDDKLHVTSNSSDPNWVASSEYCVKRGDRATFSADVVAVSGQAVCLSLSESGYANTAKSAVLLLDLSQAGGYCWFWGSNTSYSIDSAAKTRDELKNNYGLEPKFNETLKLRIEIYENGTLEGYVNDIMVHQAIETAFTEGYCTLYTYNCEAYYSNIKLTTTSDRNKDVGAVKKLTPRAEANEKLAYSYPMTDGFTTHQKSGTWTVAENVLKVDPTGAADPNLVSASEYYIGKGDRASYSADVTVKADSAVSLTLSENSYFDTAASLIFMVDMNRKTVSLWGNLTSYATNFTADFATIESYGVVINPGDKINLRLEIYTDGYIEGYVNDVLTNIGENFTTGYCALYTYNCAADYTDIMLKSNTDQSEYNGGDISWGGDETTEAPISSETEAPVTTTLDEPEKTTVPDIETKDSVTEKLPEDKGCKSSSAAQTLVLFVLSLTAVSACLIIKRK